MISKTAFFSLILLVTVLQPQVHIISEKIQGDIYTLTFESLENYTIKQVDSRQILEFPLPFDESRTGFFNLPASDIFIAIPANSNPRVEIIPNKVIEIDAIPAINPLAEVINNELEYTEIERPIPYENNSYFSIKGYLWIDNLYCIHLSINNYLFESEKRLTSFLKSFSISLKFEEELGIDGSVPDTGIDPLIVNSRFASAFKSKADYGLIKNDSWINYNQTHIKLGVALDGVYRVGYDDLINLGININSILPSTLSIYYKGNIIPIYVFGEGDNVFDPGDYIEFVGVRNMGGKHREINTYGEPYNEYLDRYSDTSVYWLTWGGLNGLRAQVSNGTGFSSDTLNHYHELIHYEKNNWFDFSMADLVRREMPFWFENKTWVDGQLLVGTRNFTFSVSNLYPNTNFFVFARLQNYASSISQNAHLLAISVNSLPLQDSGFVNKYQQKLLKGVYNSSSLNNGNNTLRIHSFTTNSNPNSCAFDWYEVEYPRYLRTFNDSLLFSFPFIDSLNSIKGIKITNVSADSFTVWKYGLNYKKYDLTRNGTEVLFFDTINNKGRFVFIKESKIQKPKIYYAKQFINLRSTNNQADYLAITHKNFINKTNEYLSFISNHYDVTAKVVDVDDIYDEFSYGFFNPEAIKDFLKATHTYWQEPKLKYVALIGQATYDYHANKTRFQGVLPKPNFVPSFGASVSDNWFVTWDTTGAYIPQMNIGRIPVKSEQELNYYMNKHINYVSRDYEAWNKRYMFFSGGTGNNQAQLDQLREVNQFVVNNYVVPAPIGGNYSHFYKTINPNTNFGPFTPEEVQRSIDSSSVFISYLGHSGTQTWDNSITQPVQLKNKINRNPLITDFGCSTARFGEPDITSFSQLFVLDNDGQAIGYIGNSSLGFLSTSLAAPKIFYKKILADSIFNISEAHKRTKLEILQTYGSSGVYQLFALTNSFIGDPIINLPIPPKPNLSVSIADIRTAPANPSDQLDSLSVLLYYYNYGKVIDSLFSISIKDLYSDSIYYSITLNRQVPKFRDSIDFTIPIKSRPGQHKLVLELDSENILDEMTKDDNQIEYSYVIASSAIRSITPHYVENQIYNELLFLNPGNSPLSDTLVVEFSKDETFTNMLTAYQPMEPFYTRVNLSLLFDNRRYWFRPTIKGELAPGKVQSLFKGKAFKYSLNDETSFLNTHLDKLKYLTGSVLFDTISSNLLAISAGYNDGGTAVIKLNHQNLIPEGNLRGHHICLLRDDTLEFAEYKRFDTHNAGTSVINDYINYLDTLTSDLLVIIAVCDDGQINSLPLKNQIKSLGSIFIDSLLFHGSWAIIGKKGAAPGSVPEAFTKPFQGRVEIDSTIYRRFNDGTLLTSTIGPVGRWDSIYVNQNLTEETSIKYKPLAIKKDGVVDTLNYLTLNSGYSDLSFVDAAEYPRMKILAEFSSDSDSTSPELYSLEVQYKTMPELGVNYQTAWTTKDTVINGDTLHLFFNLINAGETTADSFYVYALLQKPNNSIDTLLKHLVKSVAGFGEELFKVEYKTNPSDGVGNFSFIINIDPQGNINELYKDNNIYKVAFRVKHDTSSVISQQDIWLNVDGKEVLDGEYVSSKPDMKIEVKPPSWFLFDDTSAIQFYFNGKAISHTNFDNISYDEGSKRLVFTYKPTLAEGEYTLRIFAKNVGGVLENTPTFERTFLVVNEMKITQVYNYPNPSKETTNFTFNLTQPPDELVIRIYTIAGRLIKEIRPTPSQLGAGFNYIPWDGRDEDGDLVANGVYLYKVNVYKGDKKETLIEKLSIIR